MTHTGCGGVTLSINSIYLTSSNDVPCFINLKCDYHIPGKNIVYADLLTRGNKSERGGSGRNKEFRIKIWDHIDALRLYREYQLVIQYTRTVLSRS